MGFELFDFTEESFRAKYDAVAEVASHRRVHDSGGNQTQHGLMTINHQCMTGIVAAVKTHHTVNALGEPVDDLAFAFVAPLSANHDNILSHCFVPENTIKTSNDRHIEKPIHNLVIMATFMKFCGIFRAAFVRRRARLVELQNQRSDAYVF